MTSDKVVENVEDIYERRVRFLPFLYPEDWDRISARWGSGLDRVIRSKFDRTPSEIRVRDCSCGAGMQVLGLAKYGYNLSGSDLSIPMIESARKSADLRGISVPLSVLDLRNEAPLDLKNAFDFVYSVSNGEPFSIHLYDTQEAQKCFSTIASMLKNGGHFVFSIIPQDVYQRERAPTCINERSQFRKIGGEQIRINRRFEWREDSPIFISHTRYEIYDANGRFTEFSEALERRVWQESEIRSLIEGAGLSVESIVMITEPENSYHERWFFSRKL